MYLALVALYYHSYYLYYTQSNGSSAGEYTV